MEPRESSHEQDVWGSSGSIGFYTGHRNGPEDLYPSERFFLPRTLSMVSSCLDIGCAAGGFSNIMKHFNPNLKYTGIDIIPEFIEAAGKTYPDSEFCMSSGTNLPFIADSFELVFSTGILHLTFDYKEIVRSAYDVCSQYLLCDFRLTEGPEIIGEMNVDFINTGSDDHTLPYVVVNVEELLSFLSDLKPNPISIQAKGYFHPPSLMTRVSLDTVIMAFFLIEKGSEATNETLRDLDFSCQKD